MKIKFHVVLLWVLLMLGQIQQAFSQYINDQTLAENFKAQVKSMDEFIARFNGFESHPKLDSVGEGSLRFNNILALFDFEMNRNGMTEEEFGQLVTGFAATADTMGVNLHISDAGIYAEAFCRIKYKKEAKKIVMVLQNEHLKGDYYRWAIAGIRGLPEAGIIDTTGLYVISPLQHEIQFMDLNDIFEKEFKDIMGYRAKGCRIDELSAFLALTQAGLIQFDIVEHLAIHCLDVPGYVFTVEEQPRLGVNSGWLISSVFKTEEQDKPEYINHLLGKR